MFLDIWKQRGIRREDVFLVFSACSFPVFVWALINLFYRIPGFILRFNFFELIGVSSYIVAFAFVESILYFIALASILFILALILPRKWLGECFGPVGGILALLFGAIVMVIQYDYENVTNLSTRRTLFYAGLIGLGFMAYYLMTLRFPRFETATRSIFKRISVLSSLYVFMGIMGVLIVLIRNIFG